MKAQFTAILQAAVRALVSHPEAIVTVVVCAILMSFATTPVTHLLSAILVFLIFVLNRVLK